MDTVQAKSQDSVRVATWNLWLRYGDWDAREKAIVKTLDMVDADLIALQECWEDADGNRQCDLIAEALGLEHNAYGWRLDWGVHSGNAVLSRWPILDHAVIPLPGVTDDDMRGCILRTLINAPTGPLAFITTHLEYRRYFPERRINQVRRLLEIAAAARTDNHPVVIAGDFNASPATDEIRQIKGQATGPVQGLCFFDAWDFSDDPTRGETWNLINPNIDRKLGPSVRVDYVFTEVNEAFGTIGIPVQVARFGTSIDGVWPSDHMGLLADLRTT